MHKGFLAIHLHAHLPFVRHPEHPSFLEERWYFDAITETYIPLLTRFEQLHDEGVPFRLSMTLSPTLLAMFTDRLLGERFRAHLERQLELCDKELARTYGDPDFAPVVDMYHRRLAHALSQWGRFGGNLASGFRMLADSGHLELLTCSATHCLLPHQQFVPGSVERQLAIAVEQHTRVLGHPPDGIWLPECAYYPGLERHLRDFGISYFFADSHALLLGEPRSVRGVYSHVYLPNGVAAFGRDPDSSKQVWSSKEGYPGDAVYRDYYRDIGFDLPLAQVGPHVHLGDTRILTGFKYHAITGETEHKLPYKPGAAQRRVQEHAWHFVAERVKQVAWLSGWLDRAPVIVSPYDAELFGHWWFEGPDFLYWVLREAARSEGLKTIAAKDYLLEYPSAQVVTPNASSWGDGGYYGFWINKGNEWLLPHVNAAGRRLDAAEPGLPPRVLRQAQRELVLAQSSDWPFILSTGTSPGYASMRAMRHLSALHALIDAAQHGHEQHDLGLLEERDNIF
jgi:1,4-alpha-glucan branching enzyme